MAHATRRVMKVSSRERRKRRRRRRRWEMRR